MDRRKFFEKGLFAAGGLSLASGKDNEKKSGLTTQNYPMRYRTLGRTGLEVSEVSFGTYGWQDTIVLDAGVKAGINLVCTCADYESGAAERAVAPVIQKYRDKLYLLSGIDCMNNPTEEIMLERLDKSLEAMGAGYYDIYVPHQAGTVENVENPAIPRAFEKMKAAGKARFLGISTHSSDLENMLNRAIDLGYFDVILCRYNFMDYKSQMEIFERAAKNNIGVIVFKIRAGAREAEVKELQEKGLSLNHARIRWGLSNPNVSSVCVHFSSFQAVDSCLEAVNKKLSLDDSRLLERYRQAFDSSVCRGCETCMKECPHGVDVASVMRYGMYFRNYGFEKEAIIRYAALPDKCKPEACLNCDAPCENVCPHGLATRNRLLQAAQWLTV